MTNERSGSVSGLDGADIDDAVDMVCTRENSRNPEAVRAVLSTVSDGGVVSREALDDAIAHASKVVATPETRVELASMALEDARDAAEPVADRDVVRTRIDVFEERLAGVEQRLDAVQTDLQTVVDEETADIYETARRVQELQSAANDVTEAADALKLDAEEFEHWLTSPDKRMRDLETDADDLEQSLDGFDDRLGNLSAAAADTRNGEGAETGEYGESSGSFAAEQTAATEWATASIRRRVLELVSTDLGWELERLEQWHEREGIERHERTAALAARIEGFESRLAEFEVTLERLATEAWRDRYGDELKRVEETLAEMDPPVEWGTVQGKVEDHRSAIENA